MTTLLARSLNVGAATIATWMGPTTFYDYFQRFGFGQPTKIDIMNESAGLMPLPGSGEWQESFLAINAFGQALAVTPIQMISAVSALANGGYRMQPYVVQEIRDEHGIQRIEPQIASQAIRPEIAAQMTSMAIIAVQQEVQSALVDGYTVAGKTGTAQIAEAFGYHETDTIGSFIGWLPADDPQIVVYVKIDRPASSPWGSQTAAPVFSKLAKELVVLLDIPPDAVRLQTGYTAASGGG
jgi:cell division protein FtsI/penicillin-binding protein 2